MSFRRSGKRFFCASILLLMTILAVGTVVFAAGGQDSYGPMGEPGEENPSITIKKETVGLPNGESTFFTFEVKAIQHTYEGDSQTGGGDGITAVTKTLYNEKVVVDSNDLDGRTVTLPVGTDTIQVTEILPEVDGYTVNTTYDWNRTINFNDFSHVISVAGPNTLTISLDTSDPSVTSDLEYTFTAYPMETDTDEVVITLTRDKNSQEMQLTADDIYEIECPQMETFDIYGSFNMSSSSGGNGNKSASTESFRGYTESNATQNFNPSTPSPFIRINKAHGKPNTIYCYEILDESGEIITPTTAGLTCYHPKDLSLLGTTQNDADNYQVADISGDYFTITTDKDGKGGILITGLDYRATTYTIRELDNGYYTSGTVEVSGSSTNGTAEIPIASGAHIDFTATNTFTPTEPTLGRLMVSKEVNIVEDGEKAEELDPNAEFMFRVTLYRDGNPTNECDNNWVKYRMSFTDGVAEFPLKDGQSVTAINLPTGLTYKVEELDAEGYPITTVNGKTGSEISGAIIAGELKAEFVNSNEPEEPETPPPSNPSTRYGAYKYVHEYYYKDADGNLTLEGASPISTSSRYVLPHDTHYTADDVTKVYTFKVDGVEYTYEYFDDAYGTTSPSPYAESKDMSYVVATENGNQIIILKYVRTEQPAVGGYKIVHEYYFRDDQGDHFEGRSGIFEVNGLPLDETHYTADGVSRLPVYDGRTYTYDSAAYGMMAEGESYSADGAMVYVIATENDEQIIILRYIRTEEPTTPPPPPPPPELPDPNDPDSPDEITIFEDDVPKTYIKVWDPEEEEWVYLPEDEIPLANVEVPETGDSAHAVLWSVLAVSALGGIAVLVYTERRRKEK